MITLFTDNDCNVAKVARIITFQIIQRHNVVLVALPTLANWGPYLRLVLEVIIKSLMSKLSRSSIRTILMDVATQVLFEVSQ